MPRLVFVLSLLLLTSLSRNLHGKEYANCVTCHKEQVIQWQQSDHARAMAYATDETVIANFDDDSISHFKQTARFFKNDTAFFAELTEAGNTTTYRVAYVFGHYPLQQYLIETEKGKFQVFPFAWDTRDRSEGGQRWYPNYLSEDIGHKDRLHWKQPMQNWNGMCADCHSSGLKRKFDTETLTFNSHFDEINVSCASCHGDMAAHYTDEANKTRSDKTNEIAKITPLSEKTSLGPSSTSHALSLGEQKAIGKWLLKEGDSIASWYEKENGKFVPAKRDNQFMETCFACHSLRSALSDGIDPKTPFLDQFSPSLLIPPLYFADGQIREEVYVYGSFLQSRMYEAGVNCIDCHNPHSMKLKMEGNGLCLQCHLASTFQGKKHTKHAESTDANQCVNCHMPTRTFMGVDERRDHSFSIPTPHISAKTGTPNACLSCHEKDNAWVSKILTSWHGRDSLLSREEESYILLMSGEIHGNEAILRIAYSTSLPVIKRATAIGLLHSTNQPITDRELHYFINHKEPLLRLGAAQAGKALSPQERIKSYASLLDDKFKAIRITAVNNLIGLGLNSESFKKALEELTLSNKVNQWRGEGNLNQSLVEYQLSNIEEAETLLKQGIKIDPYFEANYVNLAELYRAQNKLRLEEQILFEAVNQMPKSDLIHYSLGMFYIRKQDKPTAVTFFKQAATLGPDNPQNWYIYALALDSIGQTKAGLNVLKKAVEVQRDNSLIRLGLSLSQKLGDEASYRFFNQEITDKQRTRPRSQE
ncbi:multiheme c-type cytochrome [Alteromonas sp. KUL106]|uniref:multiheme c-type cytochrome n=1 Tax=Alteromonas sp. KUL106 TaxID=2480799 RepID=UPI001357896E|nr:multiheme c-type cytochrome [Alteromonas sp. KUL106]